jgi:hypothetical protein
VAGKSRSKINAYKHGLRSAEALALKPLKRVTMRKLRDFNKA